MNGVDTGIKLIQMSFAPVCSKVSSIPRTLAYVPVLVVSFHKITADGSISEINQS